MQLELSELMDMLSKLSEPLGKILGLSGLLGMQSKLMDKLRNMMQLDMLSSSKLLVRRQLVSRQLELRCKQPWQQLVQHRWLFGRLERVQRSA